jgi:2,4'-dihydroxyacetophenone dioxygenase
MTVTDQASLWTGHIQSEDLPFVDSPVPGLKSRILHYREDEKMFATQLRAAPLSESSLHVHLGPVYAYTLGGSWGHDLKYEYVKGTYIFEPIGVVHKFFAGPDPVDAIFIGYGESHMVDEETGEPGMNISVPALVEYYFEQCEKQGLPRPNILRD